MHSHEDKSVDNIFVPKTALSFSTEMFKSLKP